MSKKTKSPSGPKVYLAKKKSPTEKLGKGGQAKPTKGEKRSPEKVYRLPPMTLGPKVYLASELHDIVDWGLSANKIPDLWLKTQGEGIKVGVCDTGRPDHKDLDGQIAGSKDFTGSPDDMDYQGHSTHVCGTLAAKSDDVGVVGVAPKIKLYTAKVLGDDGSGAGTWVANGIRWCVDQGCNIVSMSLGGGYDKRIATAVKDAVDSGVFVIAAAGNEGVAGVGYPAKLPYCVAIAAHNKDGQLSQFSSRGSEVTVTFPGEDILSCWPGNTFRRISGTSMATPFASGVVALLLSRQKKMEDAGKKIKTPVSNVTQLKEHMLRHAIDKGPPGKDSGWGLGVIDVERFIEVEEDAAHPPILPGELDLYGLGRLVSPFEFQGRKGIFIYFPSAK